MIASKGWLSLLLLVLLLTPCRARLGEKLDQLRARFGDPFSSSHPDEAGVVTYEFSKEGFAIEVTMYQDISQVERYSSSEALSDPEIQVLLTAESDGREWNADPSNSPRKWTRNDNSAIAIHEGNNSMKFTMTAFLDSKADRDKQISDAKEAKKMNTLNTF